MGKIRKYEDRLPIGEAIREFYSSIDMIDEYYNKKGYRKLTLLHKTLGEKLNWKMPYDTFRYHFNKEFKSDVKKRFLNDENIIQKNEEETGKNENFDTGPIIPRSTTSKGFNYKPNTKELDPAKTI